MGTVLDYLKEYGDYALAEKPFSEVDSLILSQFSYLKFDEMVSGRQTGQNAGVTGTVAVSLEEMFGHEKYDSLYGDERYRRDNTALFL